MSCAAAAAAAFLLIFVAVNGRHLCCVPAKYLIGGLFALHITCSVMSRFVFLFRTELT
jgi:hypothetical protein